MAVHRFHEGLPGHDPRNVLHDGCPECEARAADPLDGLCALDHRNFRQAWADMLDARWSGGLGLDRNVSTCDAKLHTALYTIAVLMERAADIDPRETLLLIDARTIELEARLADMFGPRD